MEDGSETPVAYADICHALGAGAALPVMEQPAGLPEAATFADDHAEVQRLVVALWKTLDGAEVRFSHLDGEWEFRAGGSLYLDGRLVAHQRDIGYVSSRHHVQRERFVLERRDALREAARQIHTTVSDLDNAVARSAVLLTGLYDPFTRLWHGETSVQLSPEIIEGSVSGRMTVRRACARGPNDRGDLTGGLSGFTATSVRAGIAFLSEVDALAAAATPCHAWVDEVDGTTDESGAIELVRRGYYYRDGERDVHVLWPAVASFAELEASQRAHETRAADWSGAVRHLPESSIPALKDRQGGYVRGSWLTVTENCFVPRFELRRVLVMPGARAIRIDRETPLDDVAEVTGGSDTPVAVRGVAPATNSGVASWTWQDFAAVRQRGAAGTAGRSAGTAPSHPPLI